MNETSQVLHGKIVTLQGIKSGSILFSNTIQTITQTADAPKQFILPGFIDSHVHGGGGGDTMDGAKGVRRLARFHAEHGTTTLCPTTMTNPWDAVLAALRGVAQVRIEQKRADSPVTADIVGAHLEGPFISPERLGAQPPHALTPTPELVEEVLGLNIIKLVTIAPEIEGALDAARRFAQAGVRVSVGHTCASYEQVNAALKVVREAGGVAGFTHLYNAMGALEGRNPGCVGAALASSDTYAELIFDTHHVHTGSFLSALNAKPGRLHLITDAIRACGAGDGETELGGQSVTVTKGAARLADGTLAGSVVTLEQSLRNAVAAGVSLSQASTLLSQIPADYLGLNDRGSLVSGKRADMVVLNERLEVQQVYVAGRVI